MKVLFPLHVHVTTFLKSFLPMKHREDNNENDIYPTKKKQKNHFDQQCVSKFISRLCHKKLLKPLLELSNLVLNKVNPDRRQNIVFNFRKSFPVRMKIA